MENCEKRSTGDHPCAPESPLRSGTLRSNRDIRNRHTPPARWAQQSALECDPDQASATLTLGRWQTLHVSLVVAFPLFCSASRADKIPAAPGFTPTGDT